MSRQQIISIAIALVFLVVIAIVLVVGQHPARNAPLAPATVAAVPSNQLPGNFPVDVPLESGAQVTQNLAVAANGQTQATRTFVSKNTVAENFLLYDKFLSLLTSGWKVLSVNDNRQVSGVVSILAQNPGGYLTVSIGSAVASSSKRSTVTIIYTTASSTQP